MLKTKFFLLILFIFLLGTLFQRFLPENESVHTKILLADEIKEIGPFLPDYYYSIKNKKICLTMIVKNESRIIERCLNSVKDVVDCISICDTGSTDNTVEIIEKFMQKHDIPGKIHRHKWKNFGHNRTLSAHAARLTLQELNMPTTSTYLLLLDADMLLEVEPTFNKEDLLLDGYSILQKNSLLSYDNIRLIRASLLWECIGVTHEYWFCGLPHLEGKLYTLKIDDRTDGGCKADKFERDLNLLTKGIQEDPNNTRYLFYLAQSYKSLRQFDEAIKYYKEHIAKGVWKEEVWYSKFMLGEIYEEMGFWNQALHWYLDAYQENPTRAEPLQKIAHYYRLNGQNDLAYLFAKQGQCIPYPHGQLLFIYHSVYDYQFDEEISIVAYYIPEAKEEGFEAANRLALKKGIPNDVKEQTYKNLVFYAQNLKDAQFQKIEFELPLLREKINEYYNPMNSSIHKTTNGYLLLCRTVNYDRSKLFKSRDPLDDSICTRNFLIHYDPSFKIISQKEITENFPREYNRFKAKGLEDCRLFTFNDQLWFMCATFGTHKNIIGQTLCQLANDFSDKTVKVEKFIPLKVPDPNRHEKNWLPLIKDEQLFAFYSYDPWTIYKIDFQTGNSETAQHFVPTYDFSRFRGSAAPIEFDDGYLMLVHEVVVNNQDYYLHRFLFLDKNLNIKKLSKPFVFKNKGVEYCAGMTIDHSGNQCIMPISIEDQEAWLCSVPLNTIRSLLKALP